MNNGHITWRNVKVTLGDLRPWQDNPRQMTKRQAEKLLQSFSEFGQVETIAIGPDNGVYNGHQRLSALLSKFGPKFKVDARQSSRKLTDKERRKLVVFLHAGATGEWNWDALAGWDAGELSAWGMDDDLLKGWKADIAALGNMLESEAPETADAEIDIDRAEELQEKWRVQLGEIFRMGDHAIICGDCREPDTWKRLLGVTGVDKVNGVFTSPPYAEQRKAQYGGVPTDKYVEWWEAIQANVRANLAGDGSFFVNIKPHCEDGERVLYVFDLVLAMRRKWEWRFVDELCWVNRAAPGYYPNRFKDGFEPVYHFAVDVHKFCPDNVKHYSDDSFIGPGGMGNGYGIGRMVEFNKQKRNGDGYALPSNVIVAHNEVSKSQSHAAQFPVALPDFFIRAYSDIGDTWLDPFVGSGTTIVAAANNKRRGLGIEVLPKYCAVILERMATAFPDIEIARIDNGG